VLNKSIGREDCLYLNVFAQKEIDPIEAKSVLVFIHGGAFQNGVSASFYYGPQYLMSTDIIVVTLNYRLDIFGIKALLLLIII
jgi:carboxylesterase type B